MSKTKYFIQQSWLLIVSAFCFGLLIAVAYSAWSPRIEQNKIDKLNRLMNSLLPEATAFRVETQLEIKLLKGKTVKSDIYMALSDSNECLGWAFNAVGPGFQDKIELVIAVDKDFQNFAGFSVLASNETPGFGDKIKDSFLRDQFAGAPAGLLELSKTGNPETIDSEIIAITGATVSSEAVVKIFNAYTEQIKRHLQDKKLK